MLQATCCAVVYVVGVRLPECVRQEVAVGKQELLVPAKLFGFSEARSSRIALL